jgi:hypothetical protein
VENTSDTTNDGPTQQPRRVVVVKVMNGRGVMAQTMRVASSGPFGMFFLIKFYSLILFLTKSFFQVITISTTMNDKHGLGKAMTTKRAQTMQDTLYVSSHHRDQHHHDEKFGGLQRLRLGYCDGRLKL